MAQGQVTRTQKDRDGAITALCNGAATWLPRRKADAIPQEVSQPVFILGT